VKKIALYPGSFDPITNGHVDVVYRALKVFDKIVIAVAEDSPKKSLFSVEERVSMLKEVFKSEKKVTICSFKGLLSDFVRESGITTVIRGLRMVTDFDYEFSLALMNRKQNPDMETVFFMTNESLQFVSSTMIRQIAMLGGSVKNYVPSVVEKYLIKKFVKKR